jgi:hypothetical protein
MLETQIRAVSSWIILNSNLYFLWTCDCAQTERELEFRPAFNRRHAAMLN